ncbi:MAG: N-acetyl-gamma-glutamyl-phosphate reductase [Candidatus Auribacterota bacterium]|nr:N-acetyl-gamma-glutamyl-phosphate reductase [Candidatus Auribacterota bacterium]
MLKVAVVGATGYTGLELLKLLISHPRVDVTSLTAKVEKTVGIQEVFPELTGRIEMECANLDPEDVSRKADLVFLALPHTISMRFAPIFIRAGKKVVDLSADYRFADPAVYEEWYEHKHSDREGIESAVYGLPELFREEIKSAVLLANPGCYPTGTILGSWPALKDGLSPRGEIIVDAKTGVTGAGRKASLALLFPEVNENFKAYSLASHKHTPEMEEVLTRMTGRPVGVEFAPHLLPVNRGILSTIYIPLAEDISEDEILEIYQREYAGEPFINVYPEGTLPQLREAVGTNKCLIGLRVNPRTRNLIVVSAIDNLLKGAAGQAVQNMNIMEGFEETAGLL